MSAFLRSLLALALVLSPTAAAHAQNSTMLRKAPGHLVDFYRALTGKTVVREAVEHSDDLRYLSPETWITNSGELGSRGTSSHVNEASIVPWSRKPTRKPWEHQLYNSDNFVPSSLIAKQPRLPSTLTERSVAARGTLTERILAVRQRHKPKFFTSRPARIPWRRLARSADLLTAVGKTRRYRFRGEVKPRHIAIVPTKENYRHIYGFEMPASHRAELVKHEATARKMGSEVMVNGGLEEFLEHVRQFPDSGPLLISGHSIDDGAVLMMPDGGRLEVAELHRTCREQGSFCVTVTCNSLDLDGVGVISPAEALYMVGRAQKRVGTVNWETERPADHMPDLVTRVMVNELNKHRARKAVLRISVTTTAGIGVGAGAVAYYRLQNRREEQPTTPTTLKLSE